MVQPQAALCSVECILQYVVSFWSQVKPFAVGGGIAALPGRPTPLFMWIFRTYGGFCQGIWETAPDREATWFEQSENLLVGGRVLLMFLFEFIFNKQRK